MNSIQQGETFTFDPSISGTNASAFTYTMDVLKYPGDTPTITRVITGDTETLTSAETTALGVGQWWIHIKATDSDEDVREPIKLYISKGWV